jgi:hypothetical protein
LLQLHFTDASLEHVNLDHAARELLPRQIRLREEIASASIERGDCAHGLGEAVKIELLADEFGQRRLDLGFVEDRIAADAEALHRHLDAGRRFHARSRRRHLNAGGRTLQRRRLLYGIEDGARIRALLRRGRQTKGKQNDAGCSPGRQPHCRGSFSHTTPPLDRVACEIAASTEPTT